MFVKFVRADGVSFFIEDGVRGVDIYQAKEGKWLARVDYDRLPSSVVEITGAAYVMNDHGKTIEKLELPYQEQKEKSQ